MSFSTSYVLEEDAITKLTSTNTVKSRTTGQIPQDDATYQYEYIVGNGRPYLCAIPQVHVDVNDTDPEIEREEHDLVAAADRGWQLLKEMEGQQCLYYTTGWWSYMFCYNSYVKQYHALATSAQGRQWPPPEDPNTPSFILGSYEGKEGKKLSIDGSPAQSVGELQTQSETTFLVQQLDGGTPCDLTGKPRRIEVQFHCSPGLPDRIGWIRETSTCAYQMVVYTSRLCNDVVFQPPKEANLHLVECQEIVTAEDAASRSANGYEAPQISESSEQAQEQIMVGRIELGGKKIVGGDGKRIDRGRIVMTPEERAEVVVMQKDGQIQAMSAENLKKLELNPEEVESFKKEMQKLANGADWKIERLGDANGQLSLRGVVDAKKKDGSGKQKTEDSKAKDSDSEDVEGDEVGSEEEFKHEL